MDELKEVNLETEEDPRPTFISSLIPKEQIEEIKELLCEFRDYLAWTYAEMPSLSPDVAVHRLGIKPDAIPVIAEKYADWIANIVPVKKKNGQIHICIDFRDLNKACPKDDFSLPVSELLVDNTSNYDMFSFMDGSSGYNQIKMEHEDERHKSFRMPIGIFCYTVMPFGLKNACVTYQRAMTRIFDDLIHQKVEFYVDDLVIKSIDRKDHLDDLRIVFERIRKYDQKMNLLKCAFGVSSGKFLGYVVRHRGIEVDPNKIKAIMMMPPPKSLRQLCSLQGKMSVSNDVHFKWDEECQEAFGSIKRYLLNPPILAAPIPGKPLILYTAALEESLGALLAQHNEEDKENALYYISRRLARWAVILLQFDITYFPQKAVKGQVLTDFLAAHPIPADSPVNDDLHDEQIMNVEEEEMLRVWEIYFDGASSIKVARPPNPEKAQAGIGLIFVAPEGGIMRFSFNLTEPRTNNEAGYEALITGLEITIDVRIQNLQIFGDSQLVVNQVLGVYKITEFELACYHLQVLELMNQITVVKLTQVPREGIPNSSQQDATPVDPQSPQPVDLEDQVEEHQVPKKRHKASQAFESCKHCLDVEEEDDWRQPFIDYFKEGRLPTDKSLATQIRKRALRYTFVNNTLYRRAFDQMWLRCLGTREADKVVAQVQEGLCGVRQSGPKMTVKIKRMGYYWPTMINGDVIHQPPNLLHLTIASWPFECWGTNVIGPIDSPSSAGHRFILATTNYFSKWAEAALFKEITSEHVINFFTHNVVYRFSVPRRIISDNGTAFKSTKIYKFVDRNKIDWRCSSIYYPRANGLAEAFNKILVKLLKKILSKNKREWHTKMTEALWAYRTTYKTPTKATPYSLMFGVEAVLLLEVELPSLRVAVQNELTQEQNARLRMEELDALDKIRLQAQQNLEIYRARMTKSFDRMVRPRSFQEGELVMVQRRPIIPHPKIGGKFVSN
ncbi:uncharacterized protein LOC110108077 [Dendrobium catenatum]|uniref:uncharacterized protein LOC110108077 n=1 Tax=Dendrobium catenatum TaxID=906689 RepID=UPI00109FDFB6|nr:uncharacterized protein LOC110108077 [Dendrobium catenatum]